MSEDNWLTNRLLPMATGVYFSDLLKASNAPPSDDSFLLANNGNFLNANNGDFLLTN